MTVWFGSRVYLHFHLEPMWHPMAKAYQDMAVSLNDGAPLGEINLSRIARNKWVTPVEPYKTETLPGDQHCQYRALDPGYGMIFAAARQIFFFVPDSQMRPVLLQLFFDFLTPFLLFATFYRWGWLAAVGSVVLYSVNSVFAVSAITAWSYYWDGLTAMLSMITLLWLYRLAREKRESRWPLVMLAIVLGVILGAGVWLRNSWFVFGIALLGMAAFSKTLRPWLIVAAVAFGILAGGMAVRSTELNGYPSLSTRMVWHTAFQGMGKFANPYGMEDNDLYVFSRSYQRDGIDFNYCDYNAHDLAIQEHVKALWQTDPEFIVRGIAQRIFGNVFLNFNFGHYPLWNYGVLAFAWLGMLLAVRAGGEMRMFAVISFVMFLLMCGAYAFVYYLFRQYSTPTQGLLLFCGVCVLGALGQGIAAVRNGTWRWKLPTWGRNNATAASLILGVSALGIMVLMLPPVQRYLTPNFPISLKADVKDGDLQAAKKMEEGLASLPPAKRAQFIEFVRQKTGSTNTQAFVKKHLKYAVFANTDGSQIPVFFVKKTSIDAHEVLLRASQSIQGVGFAQLSAYDLNRPSSWDGSEIRFRLLENNLLPPKTVEALLQEKFTEWNWKLMQRTDGEYLAKHTGTLCSPIRRQISQYFPDQCDDDVPAQPN